jgi:hypothetical protein
LDFIWFTLVMSDSLIPPRVVGTPEPDASADNDPELAALLDFEPVPRLVNRPDGWTPERQRRFLELIVQTGSPQQAARAMKKQLSGVEQVYRDDEVGEFRAAWDGICELVRRREEERLKARTGDRIAEPPHRRAPSPGASHHPLPQRGEGQEWEDNEEEARRAEELRDSITNKLLRSRRMYLFEIANSPGHRAAFEILTELPIDWDKARNMEAQPDEPWRSPSMRKPDMLLTAENGWLGDMVHGRDKKGELRQMLNEHLIAEGKEPVDWDSEEEGDEK